MIISRARDISQNCWRWLLRHFPAECCEPIVDKSHFGGNSIEIYGIVVIVWHLDTVLCICIYYNLSPLFCAPSNRKGAILTNTETYFYGRNILPSQSWVSKDGNWMGLAFTWECAHLIHHTLKTVTRKVRLSPEQHRPPLLSDVFILILTEFYNDCFLFKWGMRTMTSSSSRGQECLPCWWRLNCLWLILPAYMHTFNSHENTHTLTFERPVHKWTVQGEQKRLYIRHK